MNDVCLYSEGFALSLWGFTVSLVFWRYLVYCSPFYREQKDLRDDKNVRFYTFFRLSDLSLVHVTSLSFFHPTGPSRCNPKFPSLFPFFGSISTSRPEDVCFGRVLPGLKDQSLSEDVWVSRRQGSPLVTSRGTRTYLGGKRCLSSSILQSPYLHQSFYDQIGVRIWDNGRRGPGRSAVWRSLFFDCRGPTV